MYWHRYFLPYVWQYLWSTRITIKLLIFYEEEIMCFMIPKIQIWDFYRIFIFNSCEKPWVSCLKNFPLVKGIDFMKHLAIKLRLSMGTFVKWVICMHIALWRNGAFIGSILPSSISEKLHFKPMQIRKKNWVLFVEFGITDSLLLRRGKVLGWDTSLL